MDIALAVIAIAASRSKAMSSQRALVGSSLAMNVEVLARNVSVWSNNANTRRP